jgi:3-phenylpropionate/trans-cinnamate dioxygenase ferredoxin reductase subunit
MSEQGKRENIVIIGAGLAAYALATALRKANAELAITIVGDEAHPPYDRPPLSKAVMETPDAGIPYLLAPEAYEERNIDLRLGKAATAIDRTNKTVTLANGESLAYDRLVLATGGQPRKLEIPGAEAVNYLRSFEDAVDIREKLQPGASLLCIGAGVISLELAAVAAQRDVSVHVVELGDAVMARLLPAPERAYFAELHRKAGVEFAFGVSVTSIAHDGPCPVARLDDGRTIAADLIVAGIGMVPNIALAQAAGLETGRGIRVDQFGQTSDPDIYALGDVAEFLDPVTLQPSMLESWYNAMDGAAALAKTLCGLPTVYAPMSRFWTDQFGRNFQMAGDASKATRLVLEGTRGPEKFAAIYLDDADRVVFAMAADDPRRLRMAMKSIQSGEVYPDPSAATAFSA